MQNISHADMTARGSGSAVEIAPGIAMPGADAWCGLIAQMRDGVVVVDRRGVVLLANQAARLMLRPLGAGLVGSEFDHYPAVADLAEINIAETGIVAELRVCSVNLEGRPAQLITLRDVTERRRTTDRQALAEELLDQAERVARLGCYQLDLRSDRLTYTSGLSRIAGRSVEDEEILSNPRLTAELVIHPDDRERWMETYNTALATGEPAYLEHRMVRPDGEVRNVRLVGELVTDEDGTPVKHRGVVQDITDECRAEESSRESTRLLEAIAANTPAGICVKDREGRFIFANLRHQQLAGHSREQLAAMTDYDVLPREAADALAADDARVLAEGAVLTREHTVEAPGGGATIWLSVTFPIPGEDGRPYAAGMVSVDVTEQRRADRALRASEERFRLLAERSKDAIFLIRLTPPATVEYVSPAAESVYGIAPQELTGDLEQVLSRLSPQARENAEADLRSPSGTPRVFRNVRPDGSVNWVEQQSIPVTDEHGDLIALEGISRDVTDRVAAEQEQLKATRQLAQAERLESLGQLAGGIAHDFNNLLAVILGNAQLLAEDLDPADPRLSDVRRITRTAERGAELTRQLLIFSRREPARSQLVDLGEVIAGIEDMVTRTIGEDIEFSCRPAPDLPPVEIDRARIEQVLINLVVNARAAMPDGGRLSIEAEGVTVPEAEGVTVSEAKGVTVPEAGPAQITDLPSPGNHVLLTVSDTGTGMPPEVARHVFEPFFTTRETGQGTGLGLATVHGIVKQAGGHITVHTHPGQGTTFRIYLPAACGRSPDTVGTGTGTGIAGPRGHGETILLVEDEQQVRDVVTRILTRNNYRVLTAGNAKEAIDLCADPAVTIDALLTDLIMPGMPGTRLTRHLHATTRPGLPVLYMSGYPGPGGRAARSDVPPPEVTVLRKPFDTDTLLHRLRHTLGSERRDG